jgi:hypothetical protein
VAHGGSRPGAGRPLGSVNKLAKDALERAAAEGILPLDYLLRVMRDEGAEEAKRIDAAKAAAPYCHPRRAPVDSDGKDAGLTVIVQKP